MIYHDDDTINITWVWGEGAPAQARSQANVSTGGIPFSPLKLHALHKLQS